MSMPPPPPPGDQPNPAPPSFGQPSYGQPAGGLPAYASPPPGYSPYGQQPAPQGNSGLAIAGFVVSLVALIPCFWFWLLQLPGYVGTVLSIFGLKATKGGAKKGRGLAIAGLVVGIVAIALALAVTAVIYTSDDCVVDGLDITCDFE